MDYLLLEIPLFIIEIILLILFDNKNTNRVFRVCVMIVIVFQFALFGYDKYLQHEWSQYGGNHCSESYSCSNEVDKKGFVKCKYLDYEYKEHVVKCHAPESN